jgi:hypothetical protein
LMHWSTFFGWLIAAFLALVIEFAVVLTAR